MKAIRSAAVAGVAVALCMAMAASPARAGIYDVWGCRTNDRTPIGIGGWESYGPPWSINRVTCDTPTGGMIGFLDNSKAVPASAAGGWMFTAPPNVTISDYTLYRHVRSVLVPGSTTSRSYWLYFNVPTFDGLIGSPHEACSAHPLSGCTELGVAAPIYSPLNKSEAFGLTVRRLLVLTTCDAETTCPPVTPNASVTIFSARVGLADYYAPAFRSPPTGSLLSPGEVLTGEKTVRFQAADSGGGIEAAGIVVDGQIRHEQSVDVNDVRCRRPFIAPVPCPLVADSTLALDTAELSNGPHTVQLALTDVGGNRTLSSPVQVVTRNGGKPNGIGASRFARLRGWFLVNDRRRSSRTVPFSKRSTVHGVLTAADGRPIRDAAVEVSSIDRRLGAREHKLSPLTTDERGRFAFTPRAGASRTLRLSYRAFNLDEAPVATTELQLNVRAGVSLRVSPRRTSPRGRIVFRGRLLGGPGRRDTQVALFAVARRGRDRVPVATLQADRRGRFHFTYRFRRSFAPFTYYFQAVVSRQNGYPYATGRSRRVSVRITR